MRKEVLFAVILGSCIGLAIAFGIWRANNALRAENKTEATQTPGTQFEAEKKETTDNSALSVTSFENNAIVSTNIVKIEGVASPNVTIVITTNLSEKIIQSGHDGTFSQEIEVQPGANEIILTTYDPQGKKTEKKLTLVYSTEFENE